MISIDLRNIYKHYLSSNKVVTALDSISMKIESQGIVAIFGSSGSGKSTLLNIISGTDYYTDGDYYFNNIDTSSFSSEDWEKFRNENISFVYQDFKLIGDYTVKDNILLSYDISNDKNDNIDSIMQKVGLKEYKDKKVKYLSGGQQQRVAIARALAKNTPIIIADEPTANLDQENSKKIASILHDISKEKIVIVATHNNELFENFGVRKIVLSDGKILEDKNTFKEEKASDLTNIQQKGEKSIPKKAHLFGLMKNLKTCFITYFVMIFTLLLSLGVYSVGINFSSATRTSYNSTAIFNNLSPERYIVTKTDMSSFSEEEISSIKLKDNVRKVFCNDILSDSWLMASSKYISRTNFYVRNISELPKEYKGELPKSDNEIIFETSSSLGLEDFKKGSTNEFWVCDNCSHYLTIFEMFSTNQGINIIYINDNLYDTLNNELLSTISKPIIEIGTSKFNDFNFYLDDDCQKECIISDIPELFNKKAHLKFSLLNKEIKTNEIQIQDVSTYAEIKNKYSVRNNYVICNKDFFGSHMKRNILQLNVFSTSQLVLDTKYNVIHPNAVNEGRIDYKAALTLLIWFGVIMAISFILILSTYLFLKHIYKSEIKNIYIRRLLGYRKKDCVLFLLIRILISEILAILTIFGIYGLSYLNPLKNFAFVLYSNLPVALILLLSFFVEAVYLVVILRLVISKSDSFVYIEEN